MAKAPKATKSVAEKTAEPAAAAATAPLMINGVAINSGDTKGGGSVKKQLVTVLPLDCISVIPGFNPRTVILDADIEELAGNIKKDGLLTAPLVRPAPTEGTFELICGEKRLRALKLLGWTEVAVIVRQDLVGDDANAKAIATAENSDDLRKPLNAIEIGRVCKELEKAGWTVSGIAKGIGAHEQKVRRCLTLMDAPKDIQDRVASGQMAMVTGIEVAKLDDATRAKIADQLKGEVSAPEVRRLAKAASKGSTESGPTDGKPANKKKGKARDAHLAAWKPNRVKQAAIVEIAHLMETASEEEKASSDYSEMRGALSALFWDRGDMDSYILPSADATDPKEIKVNKQFAALVSGEAAKYKAPAGEETAPAEPADEGKGKKKAAKG